MTGARVKLPLQLFVFTALLSIALTQSEDDLFDLAGDEEEGSPLSAIELSAAEANVKSYTSSSREEGSNQAFLSNGVLEGDIQRSTTLEMAISQQDEATAEKPAERNRSAANDVIRWDGWRVPYAISSQFRQPARDRIAEAMVEIQRHSCVRFEPQTAHDDYIFLTAVGSGCSADVGRFGGRQTVMLASQQCFVGFGQIVHELMHVLGFFHEQARYDRDQYLDIQWQNVDPNMDRNFLRYDYLQATVLKTPYDYGSIMHYPADAFSINGEPTMVPLVKGVTNMGQRQGLSLTDIYELNVYYECPGEFAKPEFAYNLAGSSDNACGVTTFNATTHQCCGTAIIERDKLFCCGGNAYEKPASGLRHGCCGGTAFFVGSGCCNQIVFNRTTHQCCDDEIVTKTGENLDCNGNSLAIDIGFQDGPCTELRKCLKRVSQAQAYCYAQQRAEADRYRLSDCSKASSALRQRVAQLEAYKFEQVELCIRTEQDGHCPHIPLPSNDRYQTPDASGMSQRIKASCRVAERSLESYESDCKQLEDQCTTSQMCWKCSNDAIGVADTEIIDLEENVDLNCQGCVNGAHSLCGMWFSQDYCEKKPELMRLHCRSACQLDPYCTGNCAKNSDQCDNWAASGECRYNRLYMWESCRGSCDEKCFTPNGDVQDADTCVHKGCGCYDTANPACQKPHGYSGIKNTTIHGVACQYWNNTEPPYPYSTILNDTNHNFCRNPTSEMSPWCYTVDKHTAWDFCFQPCASMQEPCIYSEYDCADLSKPTCQTNAYKGYKNRTADGTACQFWDAMVPHNSQYPELGHHNNCRNPDEDTGPWCYTVDAAVRWDYCFRECQPGLFYNNGGGCREILDGYDIDNVSGAIDISEENNQPMVDACCPICEAIPDCWAFAYKPNHKGGTCWFKRSALHIVKKPGVKLGIRNEYCNAMIQQ